jgi:hypothetical protein
LSKHCFTFSSREDIDKTPREFNDLVNMSSDELQNWLEDEQSQSAGWTGGSGETVGHERSVPWLSCGRLMDVYFSSEDSTNSSDSGRRIVEILEHNPNKEPSKYREQDIDHMRRVVSYCKRHLAQEERAKQDTDSKSYRSLKNWGHDPLKS